jgi:hypothetical protein
MNVVHGVYAPPRCPASDECGRCSGRATTTIAVPTCFGGEAYLVLCAFHADAIETVYK